CEAHLGLLNLYDCGKLRTVAQHGGNPGFANWVFGRGPFQPDGEVVRRTLAEGRPFQTPDMRQSTGGPNTIKFAELGGVRTFLSVPLLKNGKVIGNIGIYRPELRPFTEQQINLVNTFAAQAVIAIENARLFEEVQARTRELTEALEQQTATSEVLGVISSSPGELEPVFKAMLANAVRICEAKFGVLYRKEGDRFRMVAAHDVPSAFAEARNKRGLFRPAPGSPADEVIKARATVQIANVAATRPYVERHPTIVEAVELGGVRTSVTAPMLKDNEVIGVISIYRQEVRPFTDKQIELLTSFANQAVIA